MAGVGGMDEFGGGLIVAGRPGAELEGRRDRRVERVGRRVEVAVEEEPRVGGEPGEERREDGFVVEEELGFDAVDAG